MNTSILMIEATSTFFFESSYNKNSLVVLLKTNTFGPFLEFFVFSTYLDTFYSCIF